MNVASVRRTGVTVHLIVASTVLLIGIVHASRAAALTQQILVNDNGYRPTWGLDLIDQRSPVNDDRYTYDRTGHGVTVYVLDSGVNASHVEFGGRVAAGYSAIDTLPGTDDCSGHGTVSAGIIGGTTYGVAKEVTIVPIRVLNCSNSGTIPDVVEGINWMIDQHQPGDLAVANMSLSGGGNSTLDEAVQAAIDAGIHVVAAAGNRNTDACGASPSRVADVIVVGGLNRDLSKVSASSYGSCLDIWAPGSDVVGPWYDSTTSLRSSSGTSVAAPHVAGAVALFLEEYGAMSTDDMTDLVTGNATTGLSFTTTPASPDRRLYTGSADRTFLPASLTTTTTTSTTTSTTSTTTTSTTTSTTTTSTTTTSTTTTSTTSPATTSTTSAPTTTTSTTTSTTSTTTTTPSTSSTTTTTTTTLSTTTTTTTTTLSTTTTTTPPSGGSSSSGSGGSSPRTTTTTTSTVPTPPVALASPPSPSAPPKFLSRRCRPGATRVSSSITYRCTAKNKWVRVRTRNPRPVTGVPT